MEYHSNFDKYVEMIVASPNYEGLYYDRDKKGRVNWVVTGKSTKGQIRQQWWDKKCEELNIPLDKGCYAKVARMIHPTGKHVCQTCGKELSIHHEYPTLRTLRKLRDILGVDNIKQTEFTIKEIINLFCENDDELLRIADYFKLQPTLNKEDLIKSIYTELVKNESKYFSPGVMCNPPDRFDGFHSYNLCCRKEKDMGRHDDNMKTYTQDRRAYEEWSDGDWNLANRIMGEFRKAKKMICPKCGTKTQMTADHIGPISLGFCHSTNFTPLCNSCNSAKNNRFTKEDVDRLLYIEESGTQVISWHSKYIWDKLKKAIKDESDAKQASTIMAKCHQNVLYLLAMIYKHVGEEFLSKYLHPEYAKFDYRFKDFDLSDLSKMKIVKKELGSKNKQKNEDRYLRIAFESLAEFAKKDNRRNSFLLNDESQEVLDIVKLIRQGEYENADIALRKTIESISERIYVEHLPALLQKI